MHNAPCPEHARGLESDLKTILARRQALGWLTAAGGYATLMLSGCGGGGAAAGGNTNISSTATLTATSSSGSSNRQSGRAITRLCCVTGRWFDSLR